MIRNRWLAIAAAAGTLLGCSEVESPEPESLHALVALSAPTIQSGAHLMVTVVVTNVDSHPVTFAWGQCEEPFEIRTGKGELVYPIHGLCDPFPHPPIVLAPGENYTYKRDWDGRVEWINDIPAPFAPAGAYLATAYILKEPTIMRSSAVAFTIAP